MTVRQFRPGSDARVASWTQTPSTGVLWDHLDDSPDDTATYVSNPGLGWASSPWMDAADITLAATERVRQTRLRVHWRLTGAGYMMAEYWRYGETGEYRVTLERTSASSFASAYTPWRAGKPAGGEWLQADLNAIRFALADSKGTGYGATVAGRVQVAELACEVETNAQPTTSSVAASGTTVTSRPTITWTFAQADGYGQTRAVVRIFDAATYGAGGFNPETAVPVAGATIDGATAAWTTTADLQNGATYRAYVKAGMAFPYSGTEGVWYSAWAYATFTISFTPPNTPTMTRTADDPNARVVLDVQSRVNTLDADTAGAETTVGQWTAQTNCGAPSRSTTQAKSGVASIRMSSSASGTMEMKSAPNAANRPVAVPGETYTGQASFRAGSAGRASSVGLAFYTAADVLIGSASYAATTTSTTTGWVTPAQVTAVAPANAATVELRARVASTGAGAELHYVDEAGVWPGSGGAWGLGGASANTTTQVEFTDQLGPNLLAANLAAPASLGDLTGWFASGAADLVQVEQLLVDGAATTAVRWGPSAAGSALDIGMAAASPNLEAAPLAAPGQTMLAAARVRAVSGTFQTRLRLGAYDAAGATIGTDVLSTAATVGTSYTQLVAAGLAVPDGACYVKARLENTGATTTGQLLVGQAQLEVNTTSVAAAWTPGRGDRSEWDGVRGGSYTVAATPGQEVVIYDVEAPRGGGCRLYRCHNTQTLPSGDLAASGYVYAAVWQTISPAGSWVLVDPLVPALLVVATDQVPVITGYGETVEEDTQVWRPKGRRTAVVFSTAVGGYDGTLRLLAVGGPVWENVRGLFESGRPLVLKDPQGRRRYIRLVSRTPTWLGGSTAGTPQREIEAAFVEVGRPA